MVDGVFLNVSTTYARTGSGYVVPSACAKAGVEAFTKYEYSINTLAISLSVVFNIIVFLMPAITNALGVMLVRLGWSMKNSLVVLLVQLSVVNTLDLIP